jgi:hypothetical protein
MTTQGSEETYKECYKSFMAIADEEVTYCNIPLEVATAEAAQLSIVAAEDREALVSAGIDPIFVDSLAARAGAFTYAAARYQLVTSSDPEARRQWKEMSPKGYELQKYLVKHLAFAYRKDKELTKAVARIREGRGHKDMVLDLLALAILADENPEPLAKMPLFDSEKAAEAKTLHNTLSDLLARSTIDPKEIAEAKKALDRAYTYYKLAANEVKDHGQFVFEGTDRFQSYVSSYRHNLGKMAAPEDNAAPPAV